MVVRTQITLAAEAHRRAKRRAGDLGISLAEYVRRVVDRDLGPLAPSSDPSQIFGLFDSRGSDVAHDKDRYVDDAVRAQARDDAGE
ncbi:MAG: hypothetical protein M3Z33_10275 [Actinomycetota bacterium]|nr:hypothetical protein [Actinomycetota bacterium]